MREDNPRRGIGKHHVIPQLRHAFSALLEERYLGYHKRMAEDLGISPANIGKYARGLQQPSEMICRQLADLCGDHRDYQYWITVSAGRNPARA